VHTDYDDDAEPLLTGEHLNQSFDMAQELVLEEQPQRQDAYFTSRAEAVENIEETITQLGAMYRDLVDVVQRQSEVAININNNMDVTLENVKSGNQELMKYFKNVSSGQWLLLKVFFTVVVFALFFVTFLG
jgi:syntaxin 5